MQDRAGHNARSIVRIVRMGGGAMGGVQPRETERKKERKKERNQELEPKMITITRIITIITTGKETKRTDSGSNDKRGLKVK